MNAHMPNEGRDDDSALQATRDVLLGPVGVGLAALLVVIILSVLATGCIAGYQP